MRQIGDLLLTSCRDIGKKKAMRRGMKKGESQKGSRRLHVH
jgi:hypothetical protein